MLVYSIKKMELAPPPATCAVELVALMIMAAAIVMKSKSWAPY